VNGASTQTADYLPEAIELITREFDLLRIILFGSRARGEARADSDLDLLIVLSEIEYKRAVTTDLMRTLSDLPVSKDIVVTTPQEIAERGDVLGQILRPALREGVTIYERPRS
jgi:predicted nucleotidyltransferase